jgi:AraC-like DNA-binding protein
MASSGMRGLLYRPSGSSPYNYAARRPIPSLLPFVERHYVAYWNSRVPIRQPLLPCASFYLVLGTHLTGVHGVMSRFLDADLGIAGWLCVTRFRPGGFRAFHGRPASELRDRIVSLTELFGAAGLALERAVAVAPDGDARINLVERFLLTIERVPSRGGELVDRAVALARSEPALSKVADLAARLGVSVRVLQMRFRDHLGISPKAMVRRCRVLEATDRVARGEPVRWAELAAACGYADQAHFIREFKQQVGATPAAYAERCGRGDPSVEGQ